MILGWQPLAWGSKPLLISKGTLIHPEDKRYLCCHRYYLDLPSYKEMKGSWTFSLAFCHIRDFKHLITLGETEHWNLKGSFHITVFPLIRTCNQMWSDAQIVSLENNTIHSLIQLSKFDPLCEKSIANWYYEIFTYSMKWLKSPVIAISEQKPINTPITRI